VVQAKHLSGDDPHKARPFVMPVAYTRKHAMPLVLLISRDHLRPLRPQGILHQSRQDCRLHLLDPANLEQTTFQRIRYREVHALVVESAMGREVHRVAAAVQHLTTGFRRAHISTSMRSKLQYKRNLINPPMRHPQ